MKRQQNLAQLSHPNIPAIYDVSISEENLLIIFEFIDGMNLDDYLDAQGPCSLDQARLWFRQIASALQHAHDNGVIHRDIKPKNIMILPDLQTAYLIDFGIALDVKNDKERLTESGWVIGTPGYMSPEQENGEELDYSTDIFSLGVTLYEALAGQRLSLGSYTALSMTTEAMPEQVDALIQDCLLPKGQRVSSASDFLDRLTGALRMKKTFSEILSKGKLYEFSLALKDNEFTADALVDLPSGQKALILVKLASILEEGDLIFPAAEILETLLEKGFRLSPEEYRQIVKPAIFWAFEKEYPFPDGLSKGKRSIQNVLKGVCLRVDRSSHDVLREELEKFIKNIELDEKETWYLHALRDVLSSLLANSAFSGDATQISNFLTKINKEQMSRE